VKDRELVVWERWIVRSVVGLRLMVIVLPSRVLSSLEMLESFSAIVWVI
jgi:hypothetical protein